MAMHRRLAQDAPTLVWEDPSGESPSIAGASLYSVSIEATMCRFDRHLDNVLITQLSSGNSWV